MKTVVTRILLSLIACVLLLPFLGLAHELLVIVIARSLAALANDDFVFQIVRQLVDSPVHAKISLETLGGVEPLGLVVNGSVISALVSKNSTVLGLYTTQLVVEFTFVLIGGLGLQAGLRHRSPQNVWQSASIRDILSVIAGLLMMSEGIWSVFRLTLSPEMAGLRETGIGVAFSLFFQLNAQQYDWLMGQGLPLLIPILVTMSALGIAWLTAKLTQSVHAHITHSTRPPRRSLAGRVIANARIAGVLIPFLGLAAILPGSFGTARTELVAPQVQVAVNPEPSAPEPTALLIPTPTASPTPSTTPQATSTALPTLTTTPPIAATPLPTPVVTLTPIPSLTATLIPSPTAIIKRVVELQRNVLGFSLLVNGKRTYIKGMNYNVNYTGNPFGLKLQLHRRDFQIMRSAGVNAVIGWGVYDQVTLDIAQEYGIGVIMPFALSPDGPFDNKNYREQIKNEFRKYVLAYKDSPAVLGWNPGGDELLHRMETELHRTPDRLQSASDFLLELSTLAYSLDPNHVSLVKEPRNVYVAYIEDSVRRWRLTKPDVDPYRYFVFAVNTYGKPEGVAVMLDTTRKSIQDRVGIALMVGEFAPFGLARSERHLQYVQIWKSVRENSSLGGFAYVFGPDQPNPRAPNPYDPLRLLVSEFSLVDMDGNPVDGSLSALANVWNAADAEP